MAKKYVVVTTVSSFSHHYVISLEDLQAQNPYIPVDPQWINDMVTCNDLEELSQAYIGESISCTPYTVDEQQVLEIFDRENDYLKAWSTDKKLEYINNRIYIKNDG